MLPGAGAMAEQLRVLAGLAKDRGYSPAPMSGGSSPPVSPTREDLLPLTPTGTCTYVHILPKFTKLDIK